MTKFIEISSSLLTDIKSFIENTSKNTTLINDKKSDILFQIDQLLFLKPSPSDGFQKPEIPLAISSQPLTSLSSTDKASNLVDSFLNFGHWIGSLKTVKRTGWLIEGLSVGQAESVAEHSFRMAMLVHAIPFSEIKGFESCSPEIAMKMCLIHDAAEAIVGDIPPSANVSKEDKFSLEKNAMFFLDSIIPKGYSVLEFYGLWDRYEKKECPESILVKDLDRIELLLQTYEYKLSHPNINCESFFLTTLPHFQVPFIKQCAEKLNELRLSIPQKIK